MEIRVRVGGMGTLTLFRWFFNLKEVRLCILSQIVGTLTLGISPVVLNNNDTRWFCLGLFFFIGEESPPFTDMWCDIRAHIENVYKPIRKWNPQSEGCERTEVLWNPMMLLMLTAMKMAIGNCKP
ncbi:uncharacterized protein [Montipora capricornis]|uniref:uncharacterized protein isoform X4 n=1 Tax=Montipora capricornis TaxID=246305 RepID=UPI0035F205DA